MHISDGLLPAPLLLGGYAATGFLTWYSLRQIDRHSTPTTEIPKASLLTAAFFAASAIRIPVLTVSVHLILNGALGAVLGFYAFPAILIGLLFQALIFGHGGLSTLGLNAVIMGGPALLAFFVFQLRRHFQMVPQQRLITNSLAFLAGSLGIGLTVLLFLGLIMSTLFAEEGISAVVTGLFVAHVPLILLEGLFTMLLINFLARVKPEVIPK